MTEINETVKVLPTALIGLNLRELMIILERRLETIKGITEPDAYERKYPDEKLKFYKRHYENVKSISDILYAMQKVLEDYIKEGTKELNKQKAKIDAQAKASGKAMQVLKANAE